MTLPRDEDSSLRHWSARLIQALQILDLEVDHEKLVQLADESVKAVGPHADASARSSSGTPQERRPPTAARARRGGARRVEQGPRTVRAGRGRRPGRKGLGEARPVAARKAAPPVSRKAASPWGRGLPVSGWVLRLRPATRLPGPHGAWPGCPESGPGWAQAGQ